MDRLVLIRACMDWSSCRIHGGDSAVQDTRKGTYGDERLHSGGVGGQSVDQPFRLSTPEADVEVLFHLRGKHIHRTAHAPFA